MSRARANIVQPDTSNQNRMSERDLMRTPGSNGPVADLANGVIVEVLETRVISQFLGATTFFGVI